jgi:D-alanyl-D-alanine-carboxypeptidase/D-alanyl-D-alanine-endopeptidase
VIYHSGIVDGFVSCMSRFPQQKLAVVVLSNYVMIKHACSIATALSAIAFGEKDSIRKEPIEVKLDPRILEHYVGEYRVSPDLVIVVTAENGRLFAQASGLPRLEIFPESETEFFFKAFDTQVEFVASSAGKVMRMVVHLPLRDDLSAEKTH